MEKNLIPKETTETAVAISLPELIVGVLKNIIFMIWNGISGNYGAIFTQIADLATLLFKYFTQ